VLDGFTRWWVEQGTTPLDPAHKAELVARALWVLDIEPQAYQLVERWQLTADRFAYPSAESLAWAAMTYLETSAGRDQVLALANEFLVQGIGNNVLATLSDRRRGIVTRFESALGMPLETFNRNWQQWLQEQRNEPGVQRFLQSIPALQGQISSRTDASGVHTIVASYVLRDSALPLQRDIRSLPGHCIMKHDYIGPFDNEFEVTDDYEDKLDCELDTDLHVINSMYSPGDRVFVALDYEGDVFHQPLRLHAERVSVQ
jgi:hypothetical protein